MGDVCECSLAVPDIHSYVEMNTRINGNKNETKPSSVGSSCSVKLR